MLLGFKAANHRSLRTLQELSLYRAIRPSDQDDRWTRRDVSTVAAIYGANASGKSTVVDGLAFLKSAVADSYRSWPLGGGTPRRAFALDPADSARASQFEIEFIADDGVTYQYGFELDDERILSEHLYAYKTTKRTVLYTRDPMDEPKDWYFGPSFRGPAQQIRETTRTNALFLSAAAASHNRSIQAAFRWISTRLSIYHAAGYRLEHARIIRRMQADEDYAKRLLTFVRRADLGVSNIEIVENAMTQEELEDLERRVRAVVAPDHATRLLKQMTDERERALQLTHKSASRSIPLPFDDESDGTHALISFASIAVDALETGSTCVVDEIDSSLHPTLVGQLVEVFQDPRINPKQAQLIFTTHDATLLESDGLTPKVERDQVWVVEKDSDGASHLFAISEFGLPRTGSNLARAYLTGRYGGIPAVAITNELLANSMREESD